VPAAATAARAALQAEPDDSEALYLLAVCERYPQQPEQALATLARLRDLRPGYARACQEAGHNHRTLRQFDEAGRAYAQAVALNPALEASWRRLAELRAAEGWLGIAGISIDSNGHITTGYTKLNDTYFSSGNYNNPLWKQSVTCQELGHNLGLDHQDEDFYNQPLNTCMDYQDPPTADPNAHDYQQLSAIYGHLDSYDSYAAGDGGDGGDGGGGCNAPPGKGCNKSGFAGEVGWGASLGRRGNAETFIRIDPDGTMHLTHVTWAIGY